MNEIDRIDIQKAMAYDLLRILKQEPKKAYSAEELEKLIGQIQKRMKKAAAELDFETAAALRDQMVELKKHLQEMKE